MADGRDTDDDGVLDGLLDRLGLDEAACVTAVTGLSEDETVRLFGGDPARARPCVLDGETAEELAEGLADEAGPHLVVGTSGPAVVVVEYDGHQGSREEVIRPLSRLGGRAASAYWDSDARSRLTLAEDGVVLSAFELLFPEVRHGARPAAWEPYLRGIALGAGEGWGGGLAAVARATGARLDDAWATGPQRLVPIEAVPRAVLPQALEDSPLLAEEPFAGYLAELGPAALPGMERHAVELAARHHGLADDPLCTLALAVLDGCGPPEARAELRTALASRATGAGLAPDAAAPGPHALAVWQTLAELLALEEGAHLHGPPPMTRLVGAMTGDAAAGGGTPGADAAEPGSVEQRFWLVEALYEAARRAT